MNVDEAQIKKEESVEGVSQRANPEQLHLAKIVQETDDRAVEIRSRAAYFNPNFLLFPGRWLVPVTQRPLPDGLVSAAASIKTNEVFIYKRC